MPSHRTKPKPAKTADRKPAPDPATNGEPAPAPEAAAPFPLTDDDDIRERVRANAELVALANPIRLHDIPPEFREQWRPLLVTALASSSELLADLLDSAGVPAVLYRGRLFVNVRADVIRDTRGMDDAIDNPIVAIEADDIRTLDDRDEAPGADSDSDGDDGEEEPASPPPFPTIGDKYFGVWTRQLLKFARHLIVADQARDVAYESGDKPSIRAHEDAVDVALAGYEAVDHKAYNELEQAGIGAMLADGMMFVRVGAHLTSDVPDGSGSVVIVPVESIRVLADR